MKLPFINENIFKSHKIQLKYGNPFIYSIDKKIFLQKFLILMQTFINFFILKNTSKKKGKKKKKKERVNFYFRVGRSFI